MVYQPYTHRPYWPSSHTLVVGQAAKHPSDAVVPTMFESGNVQQHSREYLQQDRSGCVLETVSLLPYIYFHGASVLRGLNIVFDIWFVG